MRALLLALTAADAMFTATYHDLLAAVPRPIPLTSPLPMAYGSPLTDAHKAARPPRAAGVRTSDSLFAAPATADERAARRAVLASVWLGLGLLDECHALVAPESYAGSDGAYLHALLHRREGPHVGEVSMTGFDNSRYWFGVLGDHDAFPHVRDAAAATPASSPLARAFLDGLGDAWDPFAFVALCEAAAGADDDAAADYCRAVQQAEWALLHERIAARLT